MLWTGTERLIDNGSSIKCIQTAKLSSQANHKYDGRRNGTHGKRQALLHAGKGLHESTTRSKRVPACM